MRNLKNIIITAFISLFIFLQVAIANALAPSIEDIINQETQLDPQEQLLAQTPTIPYQFKLGPFVTFWDKIAQCETSQDWQNGGTWSGGLGIYNVGEWRGKEMGTWERWGGENFAPAPQYASKFYQIIVANRIGLFGYKELITRDPEQARRSGVPVQYLYDKSPTGFGGWGCVKSKSTGKWRIGLPQEKLFYTVDLPADPQFYCPQYEPLFEKYGLPPKLFSHIAWKQSRCNSINVKDNNYGILGIAPKYQADMINQFSFMPSDLTNPEKNVIAAAWITYFHPDRLSAWGYDIAYYNEKPNTASQNKELNNRIKFE